MKKLLSILALLTLLSGCVVIDGKYTGRSRIRIYNDAKRNTCFLGHAPIVYVGYGYFPSRYELLYQRAYYNYHGYPYWYGNYGKRTLKKSELKKK